MKQRRHHCDRIVLILIFWLLAQVKCEPEWAITEKDTKYLIESKYEYTWFEAEHECAKRNLSLVAIDSSEKNFYLVQLLKNRFGLGVDLWIGGSASTAENTQRKFVWASTGKAFNYANWQQGEPNNLGGQQPCVHTWSKSNNFTWADGQWDLKYGYICEETLASKYRQLMASKRQAIEQLQDDLMLNLKKLQNRLVETNESLGHVLQLVNVELKGLKKSIDRVFEDV